MKNYLTPDYMFATFDAVTPAFLQSIGVRALLIVVCWVVGALCSLSFGPLSHISINGGNLFDFFDDLSSNVLMTLGSLMTVLFVGWRLKKTDIYDEFTNGGTLSTNARLFGILWVLIRYIAPVAIMFIFIYGLV